jgi:hypothetical protein
MFKLIPSEEKKMALTFVHVFVHFYTFWHFPVSHRLQRYQNPLSIHPLFHSIVVLLDIFCTFFSYILYIFTPFDILLSIGCVINRHQLLYILLKMVNILTMCSILLSIQSLI